jgi:hypothetical protein
MVSLPQLIGPLHYICKSWDSNSEHSIYLGGILTTRLPDQKVCMWAYLSWYEYHIIYAKIELQTLKLFASKAESDRNKFIFDNKVHIKDI